MGGELVIRNLFFRTIKKDINQAYKYENYRSVVWFCIGYTAAILMSFMNIWWK